MIVRIFGHTDGINDDIIGDYQLSKNSELSISVLDIFFLDISRLLGLDSYAKLNMMLMNFSKSDTPAVLVILNEEKFPREIIEEILSPYTKKKIFNGTFYIENTHIEVQLRKIIDDNRDTDINNLELKLFKSELDINKCIPYDYFLHIRNIEKTKYDDFQFESKYLNKITLKYAIIYSLTAGFMTGLGMFIGEGFDYKYFVYVFAGTAIFFLLFFSLLQCLRLMEKYYRKMQLSEYLEWLDDGIAKMESSFDLNGLENYKEIIKHIPNFNADYGTIYVLQDEGCVAKRIICRYSHIDNMLHIHKIFEIK